MDCPGIDFVLRNNGRTVGEEDMPKLALSMNAAEIFRLEMDEKKLPWTSMTRRQMMTRREMRGEVIYLHGPTDEICADCSSDAASSPIATNNVFSVDDILLS
jgi:hypothetical protein